VTKLIFIFAALSAMVSVMMGAFASHALRGTLTDRMQHAFETAVAYQLNHSLALLLVCLLIDRWGRHWALMSASWAFVTGICLFSGSLYLLALTDMKWLGPITPIGGAAFIVGWGLLVVGIWQQPAL
jgi:uncharacterized membrane protein YgdD (TMEM256/DUF423 family)